MVSSLKNIIFEYYLKNNLEDELKKIYYLENEYNYWKNKNYISCCCCNVLSKKEYKCNICRKYHYCLNCFENYTYYCFRCNRDHCFVCNIKRRACKNCYYN